MARENPRVAQLEREVTALRGTIAALRRIPDEAPDGCGDHSCFVRRPTGMATNGGCRCDERVLRRAVMYWQQRARGLEHADPTPKGDSDG